MRHLDTDVDVPHEQRVAVIAHLSRYRGRVEGTHTESDLRLFFDWCRERSVAPLVAHRNDLELYARWMQEVRRLKPSTVSRRMSVVTCFYRTCVIDGLLEHSPPSMYVGPGYRPSHRRSG